MILFLLENYSFQSQECVKLHQKLELGFLVMSFTKIRVQLHASSQLQQTITGWVRKLCELKDFVAIIIFAYSWFFFFKGSVVFDLDCLWP
jgi:hypothetical protein